MNLRSQTCRYAAFDAQKQFGASATSISGGYVVRDANKQALAYVYSRETHADAMQAKVLTPDEARRIAANIARPPELLKRGDGD